MSITHETSLIINAIGWTILHSLWQGLLLYSVLQIVLRIIPECKANIRYNISMSILYIMILWAANTFIHQLGNTSQLGIKAHSTAFINEIVAAQSERIQPSSMFTLLDFIDNNTYIIVLFYILGIAFSIIRLVYNIYKINTLKATGETSTAFQDMLERYKNQMNIRKKVLLILSNRIEIPMVVGGIKPVILFPIAALNHLSIEEAETILVHELAHIKRNDYLINIVQIVFETILFYNPFVWLISKSIRTEREYCCDDIVTRETKTNIEYANALAQLSQMKDYGYTTLAATGRKYKLLNRIKRIIEMKKTPISRTQIIAVIIMFVAVFLSATMISSNLLAQSNSDDDDATTKNIKKTTIHVFEERITIVDDNGDTLKFTSLEDVPQKHRKILHNDDVDIYYGDSKKFLSKNGDSILVKVIVDSDNQDEEKVCPADSLIFGQDRISVITDSIISINKKVIVIKNKQIDDIDFDAITGLTDSINKKVMVIKRPTTTSGANISKYAKKATVDYKNVITELDRDKLIDKNNAYSIILKNNVLTINGEKQPKSFIKKYFPNSKPDDEVIINGVNGPVEIKKTQ